MKQKISIQKAFRSKLYSFFSLLRKSLTLSLLNRQGITLVEILIAMAIVGILTTIAVPQTQTWIDHYRLNGAARLVWGDLQSAKMTAIKSNQSITVTFNSPTSYSFPQPGSIIPFTRNLNQEYPTITLTTTGGNSITFLSTGTTQNLQNPVVTVQGSGETKTVTTLWTGRII